MRWQAAIDKNFEVLLYTLLSTTILILASAYITLFVYVFYIMELSEESVLIFSIRIE